MQNVFRRNEYKIGTNVPLLRLLKILWISYYYRLDALISPKIDKPWFSVLLWCFGRHKMLKQPRGYRLRKALESLGPIFVKFGQVLSTRQDIIPMDIAVELSQLQDNVPPFNNEIARQKIEQGLGDSIEKLFKSFDENPVASASIAQVYFAELHSGKKVAVKVLRPKIEKVILKDLQIMGIMARLVEYFFADGKRLRPKEVVAEFKKYLSDELDLVREAANCSQLRRNFDSQGPRGKLLMIPEVHWDFTSKEVFTMERMEGIPISRKEQLIASGIDTKELAKDGVEIFFTQVFSDGFFHADMHPGNIYVSNQPATLGRYIALDFGIVGSLSEFDKNYLAQNFLAFFQRDYRRVAQLHIESGWAPEETREEELEGAIRACCEPIFDRPISQISLGMVLLRLFQTSRRFNISVQPQLVLLQKTLLNIEGLGRQLDPDLDLWKTAKPYLENWMQQRIGFRGLKQQIEQEARQWSILLPQLPRLLHQKLANNESERIKLMEEKHALAMRAQTWKLLAFSVFISLITFVSLLFILR